MTNTQNNQVNWANQIIRPSVEICRRRREREEAGDRKRGREGKREILCM